MRLIDTARKQCLGTVVQAVELAGTNRNTVRAHLKRLFDGGASSSMATQGVGSGMACRRRVSKNFGLNDSKKTENAIPWASRTRPAADLAKARVRQFARTTYR